MKIFLDDVRSPKDCLIYMLGRVGEHASIYRDSNDWVIARNYKEFCEAVHEYCPKITHISFDHDLADEHYDPSMYLITDRDTVDGYNRLYDRFKEKTGADCAKWLKRFYYENEEDLPTLLIHSMNPVGCINIANVFNK